MIPRHAPPFGLASLLLTAFAGHNVGLTDLENICAEHFEVAGAVLTPSGRAGLLLSIEALAGADARVSTSAFTCGVVYQALALSDRAIEYLDLPVSGFLANADNMQKSAGNSGVVVAGEIYGLRYEKEQVAESRGDSATPWIWDMAMCIPQPSDMNRLRERDVAVASFGLGKCMYAGWGGLALTCDAAVADRMRAIRDRWVAAECGSARRRHTTSLLLRTTLHNRIAYGLGRTVADWRQRRGHSRASMSVPSGHVTESVMEPPDSATTNACPNANCATTARTTKLSPSPVSNLGPEWTEPMTPLNRKLVVRNLGQAAASAALRERQAIRYFDCLSALGVVRGISRDCLPQSHFPIRVPAAGRQALRNALYDQGIDTATYFPFAKFLRQEDYPNSALTSSEVVLLPMGERIKLQEVEWIAQQVARQVAQ